MRRAFHVPSAATLLAVSGLSMAQTWVAQQVDLSAVMNLQGRVTAIAVSPETDRSYIVGTESGGLFATGDGGARFRRRNEVPAGVLDVAWLKPYPRQPSNVLLATTARTFDVPNRGGLWKSIDSGATWRQVDLRSILGLPPADDLSGYGISQDTWTDSVAVATSRGLALSRDRGRTWSVVNPFGPRGNPACFSVTYAYSNLLVGGTDGVRWSTDNGRTWNTPATPLNRSDAGNYHGLKWGRYGGMAYYVDWMGTLSFTLDYGQNWTMLPRAPARNWNAGGIGFVYEARRGDDLEVYFGDHYGIYRLRTRGDRRPSEIVLTGSWTGIPIPHPDVHCLAFSRSGRPYLLGTDGGLHTTDTEGSSWIAAPRRGLDALQIYDVKGQWVGTGRDRQHDLYIGTQDNYLYASADRGGRWLGPFDIEGGHFGMVPDAGSTAPVITYCPNYGDNLNYNVAGRHYSRARPGRDAVSIETDGSDPFADSNGNGLWDEGEPFTDRNRDGVWTAPNLPLTIAATQPLMHTDGRLIQRIFVGSAVTTERLGTGLAVSGDTGGSWSQLATFSLGTFDDGSGTRTVTVNGWRGMPRVAHGGRQVRIYQPYEGLWNATIGGSSTRILHATTTDRFGPARIVYPRMTGFGSMGRTNFQFRWDPIYDVHPTNQSKLAATDVTTTWPAPRGLPDMVGGVSFSEDAGETWSIDRELTHLVLGRGRYRFSLGTDRSFVTCISYCLQDPQVILVGCRAGGVYVTTTGGTSWARVPGSENMANVSSVHWVDATEAYVATFGTGLWRVFTVEGTKTKESAANIQERRRQLRTTSESSRIAMALLRQASSGATGLVEFVGGAGDPFEPRFDGSKPVKLRVRGWSPRSEKDLQVYIDGVRVPDSDFHFEPRTGEIGLRVSGRGGHSMKIVWLNGNSRHEAGRSFFIGGSEGAATNPPEPTKPVGVGGGEPPPLARAIALDADAILKAARSSEGALTRGTLRGSGGKLGAAFAQWSDFRAGSTVTIPFRTASAGVYTLVASFEKSPEGGRIAVLVDGKQVGEEVSLRGARPSISKIALGQIRLGPGGHQVTLSARARGAPIRVLALGLEPTR